MARIHSKDLSTLAVDDTSGSPVSVKAETLSLDFKASSDVHDTHTLGDAWKEATAGLKGGDEFAQELFYENTNTTGIWALFTSRYTNGGAGTLSFGDGTRSVSMETIIKDVSLPIKVGEMLKVTVTHKVTGAVTFS